MDADRAMSQYVHDRWGIEQGFPAGPVYAIAQAGDGYLWIGTEAGLVRFDGWNFTVTKDETRAFTIGSVLGLASDDNGCLWLRLQDTTILRYCRGVFDRPPAEADVYISVEAMNQTNTGEFLIWKAEDGTFGFRSGKFRKLASANDLPPSPVTSLSRTANGEVWMGTRDAGLFRATGGKTVSIRSGLPDLKVNCLLSDGPQGLWIGTDRGIARWNGNEVTEADIPAAFRRFQSLAMVRDRDGNLWVGTDSKGLVRINSHGFASLPEADNLAVTALFEDREGNLWIGHANGIERLRDSVFVTYSTPEGLPAGGSNPVFVDGENRLWFPPVNGGLWWSKGGRHGRVARDGLDRDVVYALAGGKRGLWIGRQRGGLTHLFYSDFSSKTYTRADGLPQDSIYSVYRARDGTVWAGTLSAGVSRLRGQTFTTYTVVDGLASNTVPAILEASDGTMWFATPSGLSEFASGRWRSYGVRDGLPSENINCLLEDSAGTLWIGTASGIALRSGGAIQVPPKVPETLRAPILGLAEDKSGSFWIATSSRVLRVSREKLLEGQLADGDVREFGLADGLRGVEGVKRNPSVVTDQAGRVWFALSRGISVVDPARLKRNSAPPIVHIESVFADGNPVTPTDRMRIPGGRQRITVGYVGLNLADPSRTRYRYMLEGYDRSWIGPVAMREIEYTNLGPAAYRLRIAASTPDGGWSTGEASLAFSVDPLVWQTWWFKLTTVALCIVAAVSLYRLRLRQETSRITSRFQERLAERTRIAQELHDTLLQGFLSASMQLNVTADSLPDDSPAKPVLNRSLALMRRVTDEARNVLRGLRLAKGVSRDLETAFSSVRQEFATQEHNGKDIDFRVIVEGHQRPLDPVLRDELYRIGREALVNAFRHAHASRIDMELKYSSKRLAILVRDDGRGIDPNILQSGRDGHFGLTGMRERADRIGARLRVMSSPSAGTEIELSIPGSIAFQIDSNGRMSWLTKQVRRWLPTTKRAGD